MNKNKNTVFYFVLKTMKYFEEFYSKIILFSLPFLLLK